MLDPTASQQRHGPISPSAKGTAPRLLDQCHRNLFPPTDLGREGRGWIYELCRQRNGRMKRSALGPVPADSAREGSEHFSRNRRLLKPRCNPSRGQPGGCSRIRRQPPAIHAASEPLHAFVLVIPAPNTYRMLWRHLRSTIFFLQ